MVEFITRCCHAENRYEVIVKTDSEEHYKATQDFARRLIDHAKPMTNADRIRAMSDEELAQMLNKAVVCHHLRELGYCHKCPLFGAKPCDTEGIVKWLKQPAEVEG